MGFFSKFFSKEKKETLDKGLERTKQGVFAKIAHAIAGKSKIDDEVLDNLEEVLAEEGVQLRIFGKPEIKGHRRMGVILATAETTEEALAKTARAYDKLKVTIY